MKQLLLLAGLWLALLLPLRAQTILFTEDFESGTLGGFTAANGQQVPAWFAGPAAGNGPRWAGSTGAFISPDGLSYGPLSGLNGVVHLYCDISFPATATDFSLRFDYRSQGAFNAYLAPTSYQPVAGTQPPQQTAQLLAANLQSTPYRSVALRLPASVAGTTRRLIFTWWSSAQVPPALPAALDNVVVAVGPPPALGGTYTINRQQPRTPRNFQSLTDAVAQLNTAGTSAPVTLAIAAGQRFTEGISAIGSANSHPVVFRKGGPGANPQLQAEGFQTAISLVGSDHITFDGLDIVPGATGPNVGYSLENAYNKGCDHIVIRNASITLRQNQEQSKGIYQRNLLLARSGPGDTALVNRHIRYENLAIQNACHGLWISAGIGDVPEYDVEVSHVTVGDGTAGNIGYSTAGFEAYGMYLRRINGLNVHDNLVQGVVSRMNYAVGIYIYDLMGPLPSRFENNRIRDIEFRHPADATMFPSMPALAVGLWLLEAVPTSALATGHSLQVVNNEISQVHHSLVPGASIPTQRYGQTHGILAKAGGFATSTTLVAHNTVAVEAPAWPNFNSNGLLLGFPGTTIGTVDVVNNLLFNTTPARSIASPGVHTLWYLGVPAAAASDPTAHLRVDYNNLVSLPGPQNAIGGYGTTSSPPYATLAAWQAGSGQDAHSVSINPQFAPGPLLRPTNLALDNAGTPLASVPLDLEGTSRGPRPDLGAYEFGGNVTGILARSRAASLHAWPVPFESELHIIPPVQRASQVQFELLDAVGRVVRQQTAPVTDSSVRMSDLQNLPAGPYLLRLRTETGQQFLLRVLH